MAFTSIIMKIRMNVFYISGEDTQDANQVPNIGMNGSSSINDSVFMPVSVQQNSYNRTSFGSVDNVSSLSRTVGTTENRIFPPPPPSYFLGYTLPPGHPCNSFTLPPPPADKKRTGPRRKFS